MLQRYLLKANLHSDPGSYLLKPAYRSKSRCDLIKKYWATHVQENVSSEVSCTTFRYIGIHSRGASGASVAANAESISDRCLKRHGRWKTEKAKDGYINESSVSLVESFVVGDPYSYDEYNVSFNATFIEQRWRRKRFCTRLQIYENNCILLRFTWLCVSKSDYKIQMSLQCTLYVRMVESISKTSQCFARWINSKSKLPAKKRFLLILCSLF